MPAPRAAHTHSPRSDREDAVPDHDAAVEIPDHCDGLHQPVAGLAHDDVQRDSPPAPGGDPLGGTVVSPDIADTLRRRRGSGSPLPSGIAGTAGEVLDTDLTGVRLHHDSEADLLSRSMQAAAFTHGSDIYLTGGAGTAESSAGRRLLAHELVHVAQNARGGAGSAASAPTIGRAHDPAEAEADHLADRVLDGLRNQYGARDAGTPTLGRTDVPQVHRVALDALRRQSARAGGGAAVIRRGFLDDIWSGIKSSFVPGKSKKTKKRKPTKKTGSGSTPSRTPQDRTPEPVIEQVPDVPPSPVVDGVPEVIPEPVIEKVTDPVVDKVPDVVPEEVAEKVSDPVVDQAPEYPRVVTIGTEKVNLEQEGDLEEATSIMAELKATYGIDLSSSTAMEGVKGNLSTTVGGEIAKLRATTWEMKELRSVRVAISRFAPILGKEREKSTVADKAQGVTTVGRVTDAFDDSPDGPKLAGGVMGEYFGKNKSVGLFNTTTDLVDPRYVREGNDAPDNATTIEANAIHEMAHGLVQPLELTNWISKLEFWTDQFTPSGKKDAEEPPTPYGKSGGAAEDLCESVAIFFVNRPMLKKVAPEREAFVAKVVDGWTPVKKQEVLVGATTAKGTGE